LVELDLRPEEVKEGLSCLPWGEGVMMSNLFTVLCLKVIGLRNSGDVNFTGVMNSNSGAASAGSYLIEALTGVY
jgi:hypothetical protein